MKARLVLTQMCSDLKVQPYDVLYSWGLDRFRINFLLWQEYVDWKAKEQEKALRRAKQKRGR